MGWGLPGAHPKCCPCPAASLAPSGSMLLMFSTAMRLFTSLLMLWATPGYCMGGRGGVLHGQQDSCRAPTPLSLPLSISQRANQLRHPVMLP